MATVISTEPVDIPARQACAVPFRRDKSNLKFCVITSSQGRWLFPKGSIEPGSNPTETALREAYEEAGLHGHIVGDPLGYYEAPKNGNRLPTVALLMEVEQSDRKWPEGSTRERRWITPREARKLLRDQHLAEILGEAVTRLSEAAAKS